MLLSLHFACVVNSFFSMVQIFCTYMQVLGLFSGAKEAMEVKISNPSSDKKIASAKDGGKSVLLSMCNLPIWTYMQSSIPVLLDQHALYMPSTIIWKFFSLKNLGLKIPNFVVETSVPTIILFCVICKDVDNLYKWQTLRPKGLHHSQISHADNNITIIHDIYRVYIDIMKSNCSIIINGRGFIQLEKASQEDGLKTRRFLNSSPTARRSSTSLSIFSL